MSPASVSRANPLDLDFLATFMDGGREGHGGRAYMNLPNEIKAQVSFHSFLPGPHDIGVIWSRTKKRWSYLSLLTPNTAPFVVKGFGGAMKTYCGDSLKPAPTLRASLHISGSTMIRTRSFLTTLTTKATKQKWTTLKWP
jgi:hypothetical protein